MAESYQDKLDAFSRGRSFLKLRRGVPNSTGEPCAACGSSQPGTLFGIRELVTGLDHFVGYNCLQELIRMRAVLQSRVRETTQAAFSRAQKSKERSGNGRSGQTQVAEPAAEGEESSRLPIPAGETADLLPLEHPVIATPTLVVWETEDAFRAAVQVEGHNGLATVWGAAEQPKWHQLLTLQPHNGFLLTEEKQCDRAALARCVRLATHNAYLTLESQLDKGNGSKVAAAEGASNG